MLFPIFGLIRFWKTMVRYTLRMLPQNSRSEARSLLVLLSRPTKSLGKFLPSSKLLALRFSQFVWPAQRIAGEEGILSFVHIRVTS